VHLSPDEAAARRGGARRGQPVILVIQAGAMRRDSHAFQIADNGVWLTPHVPPRYIWREVPLIALTSTPKDRRISGDPHS
jgi:RNA:NAD 2'-phosphotransferase (TPT1/KptA family)